jgi:hypothetical protein
MQLKGGGGILLVQIISTCLRGHRGRGQGGQHPVLQPHSPVSRYRHASTWYCGGKKTHERGDTVNDAQYSQSVTFRYGYGSRSVDLILRY